METSSEIEQTFPLRTFDEQKIALANFSLGDLQRLDEKVKSMMETSQNLIGKTGERAKVCKVCGKEGQIMAIILRATTWTECRFPIMSVEENSGGEAILGGANVFLIDQSDKLKV